MPVLLLAFAVFPAVLAWQFARRPPAAARVDAFLRRHHLTQSDGNERYVVAYLSHTRRWRTAGVFGGYLMSLAAGLPYERVALEYFPLLAGWFLGTAVAEFGFRPRPEPDPAEGDPAEGGREEARTGGRVPGWLLRVPYVLAGAALGGTLLVLASGRAGERFGPVLAWGAGALACAATVAAVQRRVNHRAASSLVGTVGTTGPGGTGVGRAVAAHAVGVVTAGGSALAVFCLARQLLAVGDRFFDAAGAAAGGIALLWICGGVVLAGLIVAASRRAAPANRSFLPVLLTVAALVAASLGWAGYAWWHDRPPYSAAAVHATATLRFTDERHFTQDAGALGVTGLQRLLPQADRRQFVGRVDYTTPAGAGAGGTYYVFAVDKRRNQVVEQLYDADGSGWGSLQSSLAARYPWLSATAPTVTDAGVSYRGASVSRPADAPGPLTFTGSIPDAAESSPADLMVVLVLVGPDRQIYWANRVSG